MFIYWDSTNMYFSFKENEKIYTPKMRSKGRQLHLAFYISIAAMIGAIVVGIVMCFGHYVDQVYQISLIEAQLKRALSTNDLNTIANYIDRALGLASNLTGNPDWFFPTDVTNWDLIKSDLLVIANNTRLAALTAEVGSDAYEEALRAAYTSLNVILGQLDSMAWVTQFSGATIAPVWAWIGIFIGLIIFSPISYTIYDNTY